MSLFDELVAQALQSDNALGLVRRAVEKELLHHDILREMAHAGLLSNLVFIGGTCLRACYGAPRLSEDLDFAGGLDFSPEGLSTLKPVLENTMMEKYGLPVNVSEPVREGGNVSTWKLRIETRPAAKHLPAQRVHVDVCALPSHQARPSLLRNTYGVNMGTEGLIVQAQSREEILADKWVALAFRPNRIQYRDPWDILWLNRRGTNLDVALLKRKLEDRQREWTNFIDALSERIEDLQHEPLHLLNFRKEMERFLPVSEMRETVHQPQYWSVLQLHLKDQLTTFDIEK